MNKNNIILLIITLLLSVSCKKDVPPKPDNSITIPSGNNGVYIINEGNFQFGNATISYYTDGMTDATEDLFQPANNRPLGDVCQSMCLFNDKAYIVINNSGKVEVTKPNTFESIATITGLSSPRYILPVSNSKAYITDLHSNKISIIDLSSNTISGTIPCSGWTEELLLSYGKVFVTNKLSNKLYVINSMNDLVIDSISIGYGANSIVEDKNGKLWVLCNGDQNNNINASLHLINPINNIVENSYTFNNSSASPWRLSINNSNDTLYFLNNSVYRMAITDNTLPTLAFISQNDRNLYGLGIDPYSGNIYVSDAIDYVQRGKVYVYKSNGSVVTNFLSGIIPGEFCFK